jgi:hypothetical protein
MGKWGLRAGMRLEQAKINARFMTSRSTAEHRYSNLIPNIILSRQFKGASIIKLSYTQRINRPDLYFLNPYVDNADPWNISYGNPHLQPAIAHVFNLAYNIFVKHSSVIIALSRYFTNNAIQQFTTLGADTVARTTYGNIGSNRNYNFSLGANATLFKKLSLNLNSGANHVEYSTVINNKPRNNEGFTYYVTGSASLRLKTWRLGGTFSYNAPNVFLQGKTAGYTSTNLSLHKYLFKNNKANIGLSIANPFQKQRHFITEVVDPAFYQLQQSCVVVRRYNFSVYYNFTKIKSGTGGHN